MSGLLWTSWAAVARAAVREAGYGSMDAVQVVVLETDAEPSVPVEGAGTVDTAAFEGVGMPDEAGGVPVR